MIFITRLAYLGVLTGKEKIWIKQYIYSSYIAQCQGILIPESGKILLMESGNLGFGIQNTAQGIRNPTNDWISRIQFY